MRLSTLGLISIIAGAISVAPAFAGTPASISGSATFVTPAGFTSTVSAESVLPSGLFFQTVTPSAIIPAPVSPGPGLPVSVAPNTTLTLSNAAVLVVPTFNVLGFSIATTSLSVGSAGIPLSTPSPTSFSVAAARILADSAAAQFDPVVGERTTGTTYFSGNIDFIAAIVRAGAGVNGLD